MKVRSWGGMARDHDPRSALPDRCFVSHSYLDEAALARLLASLPQNVEPDIFAWEDPDPARAVSDGIVERIRSCDGLIYLEGGASHDSGWVFFERDFALRAGKPVFAFDAASKTFSEDLRAPQKLNVQMLAAEGPAALRASRIQQWMREQRDFRIGTLTLPRRMKEIASFFSELAIDQQLIVWLLDSKSAAIVSFLDELEFDDSEGRAPDGWWPPPMLMARVSTEWQTPSHEDPDIDAYIRENDPRRHAIDLIEGAGEDGLNWNRVDLLIVRILLQLADLEREHRYDGWKEDDWDDEDLDDDDSDDDSIGEPAPGRAPK